MSQNPQQRNDPLTTTFADRDLGNYGQPASNLPAVLPGRQGDTSINVQGDIITAQRVALPRNLPAVMAELKASCAAFGDKFLYGWDVKDNRNNRTTRIEGPSIKLANVMARLYGNCMVNVRVQDSGAQWLFLARFVDLQTGFSMERGYMQRKEQNVGMKDQQRALDMVFQIGQSKAIRNVVVNALQELTEYCVEESKKGLGKRVAAAPEEARTWIKETLGTLGVDLKRVEAIYGRTADKWTVPNMARIYQEVISIRDKMVEADDIYPEPGAKGVMDDDDDSKGNSGGGGPGDAGGHSGAGGSGTDQGGNQGGGTGGAPGEEKPAGTAKPDAGKDQNTEGAGTAQGQGAPAAQQQPTGDDAGKASAGKRTRGAAATKKVDPPAQPQQTTVAPDANIFGDD